MGCQRLLLSCVVASTLWSLSCSPSATERVLIADQLLVGEAVGTYVLPLDLRAVGLSNGEMQDCAIDLWTGYKSFWVRPLHSAAVPYTALAYVGPSHVTDVFEHRYIALAWDRTRACHDLFDSRHQLIEISVAENDAEVIVRHLQAGLLARRIDRELDLSDIAVICTERDLLRAAMLHSAERADTSTYTRLD